MDLLTSIARRLPPEDQYKFLQGLIRSIYPEIPSTVLSTVIQRVVDELDRAEIVCRACEISPFGACPQHP